MTEYSTDSHLNANCISIAEELEAHANSRAYTDEYANPLKAGDIRYEGSSIDEALAIADKLAADAKIEESDHEVVRDVFEVTKMVFDENLWDVTSDEIIKVSDPIDMKTVYRDVNSRNHKILAQQTRNRNNFRSYDKEEYTSCVYELVHRWILGSGLSDATISRAIDRVAKTFNCSSSSA